MDYFNPEFAGLAMFIIGFQNLLSFQELSAEHNSFIVCNWFGEADIGLIYICLGRIRLLDRRFMQFLYILFFCPKSSTQFMSKREDVFLKGEKFLISMAGEVL